MKVLIPAAVVIVVAVLAVDADVVPPVVTAVLAVVCDFVAEVVVSPLPVYAYKH